MKIQDYKKYRKYERLEIITTIFGPIIIGIISIIVMCFVDPFIGLVTAIILGVINVKLAFYYSDLAVKYMLSSYESGDDIGNYINHLLL